VGVGLAGVSGSLVGVGVGLGSSLGGVLVGFTSFTSGVLGGADSDEGLGSSLPVDEGTTLLSLGLQRPVEARLLRVTLFAGTAMSRASISAMGSGWATRAATSLWL